MVFKPGSTSAAAILLDAFDLYEHNNPRADEIIRNIRPELAGAVDLIIEAAGLELEPYWQKRLMNVSISLRHLVAQCLIGVVRFIRLPCMDGLSWISTIHPISLAWGRI